MLKFEPKVSNFPVIESGKPVSITTATGKVCARVFVIFVTFKYTFTERPLRTYKSKKQKFFCSESNGSRDRLPLPVKIETKAQILAKRPAGATGDHINKKYFCFLLLLRIGYQCKFL